MKKCKFDIEAFFGIPFDYENWYESMIVELTDEQFDRYCEALRRWQATDEWKNWNDENGHDNFIKMDLPDIWQLLQKLLAKVAPVIWDERIIGYLDQINVYTADEIYESIRDI